MAKDLTAIRIEGGLIEALKHIITNASPESVYHDRSVNWMIGRAVAEFIERNKPKSQRKDPPPVTGLRKEQS